MAAKETERDGVLKRVRLVDNRPSNGCPAY